MDNASLPCTSMTTVPDTSANSTLNPFEADSVESLHLTQFSPSVFAKSAVTPASSKSTKFRWSIDHLAVLLPADIDENAVQQESTLDSDTEERAQRAIDKFFSQQHVVPSPWSVKRPVKHVTFSPNPPTISEADDSVSVAEALANPSRDSGSCGQQPERSEVSCQTTVTIPIDFDLQAVLGERFTFVDRQEDEVNDLCSSTLRRKLFSYEVASPPISPIPGGLARQPSPDRIPDIPSPQVSPIKQVDDSTLSASDISNLMTPGSAQSQFSSSPISSKQTPHRWTPYGQASRGPTASPTISPISGTRYPGPLDSGYPRCDLAGMDRAPSCVMDLPDASPILADGSHRAPVGMMSPFLASIATSSVEMMPVPFPVEGNLLMSGMHDVAHAGTQGVKGFTSLPLITDPSSPRDFDDRSDCSDQGDFVDSAGDSDSSGPAASSVCSMEQSYLTEVGSRASADNAAARHRPGQRDIKEADEEMLDSLYLGNEMLSFDESANRPSVPSEQQMTSSLRLSSHAPRVTDAVPAYLSACPGRHADSAEGSHQGIQPSVVMEMVEPRPRPKGVHRNQATPMQSDSGFNTQSFSSMEVNDNDLLNCMQSSDYSVDDVLLMGDKENMGRWENAVE